MRVELHTHTSYSYDSDLSFAQIIEKCKAKKIDILGVTDHNQIEGALKLSKIAPFKVIVGQEILTQEGEIIGLFITKFIQPGQSIKNTIKEIRKQKGIVYLPHPFDNFTRKTAVKEKFLESIMPFVDVIEIHNGRTIYNKDNIKAFLLAKKHKKLMAIGSDAHTVFEFGRNFMDVEQFDSPQEFLKNLQKAKLAKARFIPWVFLITKFVRFKKRKTSINHQILKERICDLCGSSYYKIVYSKKGQRKANYLISDDSYGVHPQIVQCIDCGLVYCYPREIENKIVKRYIEFKDETYEKERLARIQNQKKIIVNLEKLLGRKGKILEIGSATGSFLEAAQSMDWEVTGIEPSKWAVKYAKDEHNISIHQGILKEHLFKKHSFDAVVLIDVIEHVDSPRQILTRAKDLLKDDGVLVLVTPNIKSLLAKVLKEKWWHIRPDHLYYFSYQTLKLLVESLGLRIVRKESAGWNFSYTYWISRFKNNINFLYSILAILPIKRNFYINFGDSLEIYAKKENRKIKI